MGGNFFRCLFAFTLLLAAPPVRAETAAAKLVVQVYPALIPDNGVCNLFADRIARFDFCFMHDGDKVIEHLHKAVLTVDLPPHLAVRSVAVMQAWRYVGKRYDFPSETVRVDGEELRRYTLPLPNIAVTKMKPSEGFEVFTGCRTLVFVEARGKLPETCKVSWKITGGPVATIAGAFPVRFFPSPRGTPHPQRLVLTDQQPIPFGCNDVQEIASTANLLREVGISVVDESNARTLREAGLPNLWAQAGFAFLGPFHKGIARFGGIKETTPSEDIRDYLVGLDGRRSKGRVMSTLGMRIFCPISEYTPGRYAFEMLKKNAFDAIANGARWVVADLEPPIYGYCFCDDCRKAFAKHAGLREEEVMTLKPAELVLKYVAPWYRFRSWQTAQLYWNIKQAVQAKHPEVQIVANEILLSPENDLGELPWGVCQFAEDPRLIDGSVDAHTMDTLYGFLDGVHVDAQRRCTTKPLWAATGSSYCVHYSHGCVAARRALAEKTGRPLGYNRRGDIQKLDMVHVAASGARGINVTLSEDDGLIEAEVATKVAEASAILAKTEDFYLDGRRADEAVEVVDLTEGDSPFTKDKGIISGRIWSYFWRTFGAVQYRVHRRDRDTLVSLFNWDLYQDKQWLVRFRDAPGEGSCVSDLVSGTGYLLPAAGQGLVPKRWTKRQLEEGFRVTVPAVGMVLLRFAPEFDATGGAFQVLDQNERRKYLKQAAQRKPANQYFWRTGRQYDLEKKARHELQPFLKSEVAPRG